MKLVDSDLDLQREEISFDKVKKFNYLGATLSIKNNCSKKDKYPYKQTRKNFLCLNEISLLQITVEEIQNKRRKLAKKIK